MPMTAEHEVGKTERSVFKIGQSYAVTLPKEFVDAHGIKEGDKILITYNSFALIEPKAREEIIRELKRKAKKLKRRE